MTGTAHSIRADQANLPDVGTHIDHGHSPLKEMVEERDEAKVVVAHPEHATLHMLGKIEGHDEPAIEIAYGLPPAGVTE
ncbi:hypothetical protein C7E18_01215 [Stenotrophomonas maltophilia]|nr:hypothetical protein C7E18_01215 [Stenotrophomonas maltophilia]